MFSWAKPGDMLVTKLFMGTPCPVDAEVEQWRDKRATPIPLPGHTLGSLRLPDARRRPLHRRRALRARAVEAPHRLPYAIDPDMVAPVAQTRSATSSSTGSSPATASSSTAPPPSKDIAFHADQIRAIEELLLVALKKPRTTEEAIQLVSAERGLSSNPAGYWLAVTTVKGYLGNLLGRELLEFSVVNHTGVWHTVG